MSRLSRPPRALPAGLLLVAVLLAACNAVGPRAVRTARAAYNEVLVDTWNEQLLLNLVRLRYRDTPFFLEISSVSTHYSFEGSAAAAGEVGGGDAHVGLGLGGTWTESPTVTYAPLSGETFVKQLLTPISLQTLFLLPQSGWSVERVLRCCVQRMNGLPNAPSAAGPTPDYPPTFEDFHRAAKLLRRLQIDHGLELGVGRAFEESGDRLHEREATAEALGAAEEDDLGQPLGPYLLRFPQEPGDDAQLAELRHLLGFDQGASGRRREFAFTLGALDREPWELALYPRSLMGVMFYLSQAVEPPARHVEKGWVTVTRGTDGELFNWQRVTGDLLRVQSSDARPAEAFVAVPYRGAWFYIADSDLQSKSTFGLLAQLFSLSSGDTTSLVPVLTLPVGR